MGLMRDESNTNKWDLYDVSIPNKSGLAKSLPNKRGLRVTNRTLTNGVHMMYRSLTDGVCEINPRQTGLVCNKSDTILVSRLSHQWVTR
jgi:hypothetical protein